MKLTVKQRESLAAIVHNHLNNTTFEDGGTEVGAEVGAEYGPRSTTLVIAVEKELSNEERHAITTFVGCTLSSHGLVYWPISTHLQQLKIGYRPFIRELDSSLLASIYH